MRHLNKNLNYLAKIFATYLPPEYPYDVVGASRVVKLTDFDERIDILPVADPNIFSMTQRVTLATDRITISHVQSSNAQFIYGVP